MRIRERLLQAMAGEDDSLGGSLMRGALLAATPLYAAGNAARSAGFALGVKRCRSLGRPTVSIGNLTTGGTGKTPMVGWVVRQLAEMGHKPCILLRGYRGGDEAEEHRRLLGELAHVEPNPDRVAAAAIALGEPAAVQAVDAELKQLTGKPALAQAEHTWTGLLDREDNALALDTLADASVMGVVGIGNPAAFTATLEQHAGQVVHCEALPDHHGYTRAELLRLIDLATTAGARAIVTTEKDWVKWSLLLEDATLDLPVYRARLSMRFREGEAALRALLGERLVN